MKIQDIFQETTAALSANKIRSGLTILGIVIGIGSVIAMVSVGQGAQNSIESSIQSIGSNLVLVMPGEQRGQGTQVKSGLGSARSLTLEDADAIAKDTALAKAVAPEISGRQQLVSRGKNTNTSIVGVTDVYSEVRKIEIDQGNFITAQNNRSSSKVAVLGPTTRDTLFGEGLDVVGETVRIKNMEFKIIGVTKAKGGSGFGSKDDVVYIPLTTAQRFLIGDDHLSTISVEANNAETMTEMQQQITDILLQRHSIKDPTLADFNIMNQADIVATASSVTGTFTILLSAIAGISLLVGGIGIMNMMLTTVTERTREIGLRKAIGAKKRDINLQFLSEAVTLTFIGGFLGIVLGWLIAFGFSYFAIIQTQVTISSVLLAFGFSAFIGIVFGYYPAKRAASLNPIEALRYE